MLTLVNELRTRADGYEANRDSRCVFTRAYAVMTIRLARCLEEGRIADPEWVTRLAEAFAARYFAALDGQSNSSAWQAVLTTLAKRRTSVVEDLVFPMAGHIVRDLPHALGDVAFLDQGLQRIYDYHAVNAIMGEAVDEIQNRMSERYAPNIRILDRMSEGYDEILTNYGVRLSRGMAWYNAMRLADPASKSEAEVSIEKSPQEFMSQVMNPPIWSLRIVLWLLRRMVSYRRRWPAAEAATGATVTPT
jgi:hypothetical protein